METSRVIIKPIASEASLKEMELNRYVFEVDRRANKKEIASAVKEKFGVDIVKVQTRIIKGKSRRALRRREQVKLGPIKKATVEVKKGQKIEIFETKKGSSTK